MDIQQLKQGIDASCKCTIWLVDTNVWSESRERVVVFYGYRFLFIHRIFIIYSLHRFRKVSSVV